MKAFLSYLILPLPVFLLFLASGLVLLLVKRRRAGKVLLLLAIGFFLIVSTPFVPELLAHQLEKQYPVFDTTAHDLRNPSIMVSGAGHLDHPIRPASVKLSQVSSKRLMEGVRLYHALPDAKLITSAASKLPGYPTHAEINALAAMELQVDARDTLMLTTPTTTYEEARAFVSRFGAGRQVILVTSATHMPRAIKLFTATGTHPIPAPTDFWVDDSPESRVWNYFPNAGSIMLMEKVVHEYAGILYWLLIK